MVVGSRTLVLAFTPCALTCVYRCWSWARVKSVDDEFFATPDGKKFWDPCGYIAGFIINQLHLEVGVARNDAITENTVTLFVGMCIRTATFIVGKPGTSKSLFLLLDLLTSMMLNRKHPFEGSFPSYTKKVFQCDPLVTPKSIRAGQTAAAEAAEAFF